MERRDLLKLLASTTTWPSLSAEAIFLFEGVHAQIARASVLKTLNPQQDATVATIAELIIPQTNTPGAKAAKVNEFIDVMLSDWCDESMSARFLAGLADVDSRSRQLFGRNFVECQEADQKKLLAALDEEAIAARGNELHSGSPMPLLPANFFGMMKTLTLVGYYTSEAGFKEELRQSIIPPSHKGCAPLVRGV